MASAAVDSGDEAAARDACELFTDLIESPAPVLGPAIPELARWSMQVAAATHLELDTREMALQVRGATALLQHSR